MNLVTRSMTTETYCNLYVSWMDTRTIQLLDEPGRLFRPEGIKHGSFACGHQMLDISPFWTFFTFTRTADYEHSHNDKL